MNTKNILIVEDDSILLEDLDELLKLRNYKVQTAVNGKKGLSSIEQQIPDLVILDLMMPEMNGYELLKLIRGNLETELIPVIILTAKVDLESQIIGLSLGADDYITKPFEFDVLDIKIQNLLVKHDKLINAKRIIIQYPILDDFTTKPNPSRPREINFINNLNSILNQQLNNSKLSVSDIANSLNISSSTFNRKLKIICNTTPNTYITIFRLNRAKEMIHSNSGNISQIALKSGFSSLSYFSVQYKKYFGSNPSKE